MPEWRPRRTVLFTPGTRPDRWAKALDSGADVIVADLEDAVAPADKAAARAGVAEAVKAAPTGAAERAVRINAWPSPWATADLDAVAPAAPDCIVVPKAETAAALKDLAKSLHRARCDAVLLPIIETARGVLAAEEIAAATDRVAAVAFGAEDYAADVGARRSAAGTEVLFARSRVVAAAAVAGIDAIDQVFVAYEDELGLAADAAVGAALGYRGKMVIHPRQIAPVHAALRPAEAEVAWATKVIAAVDAAGVDAGGVVTVDGRMIDRPLIRQARRVLAWSGRD